MHSLTASKEDYLKTIHTLDPIGTGTRVVDIAGNLDVSRASASRAVSDLAEMGLAQRLDRHRVVLTRDGRAQARNVKSRYETIRLFFIEVLCVDSKTASAEACRLEHTLSDVSVLAMRRMVDENGDDWAELARMVPA